MASASPGIIYSLFPVVASNMWRFSAGPGTLEAMPKPPILSPADPGWYVALGSVARAIGSDEFPGRLLRLFASLIRHDMAMVVRYARFSAPDFLVCEGLPNHIVELYRSGYYRFDPFYDYWQKRERGGVVSLRDVSPPGLTRSRYRRVFQRQANICDELGMFLPGVGRASIALFLERSQGWFTGAEKERARRIYPAIAGLYRAHLGRIFAELGNGHGATGPQLTRATLLVDRAGAAVFASKAWREAAADPAVAGALAQLGERRSGQAALRDNRVLHVEPLEPDFPLAPGGRVFVIERRGLKPAQFSRKAVPAGFGAGLTPREREIVGLILEGHPSATIAERLGIGRGTVKNHRRRLYEKLDITTERELFLMYLDWLAQADAVEAAR
jgi:DNA-binding CsgD family transcriptional regulator